MDLSLETPAKTHWKNIGIGPHHELVWHSVRGIHRRIAVWVRVPLLQSLV